MRLHLKLHALALLAALTAASSTPPATARDLTEMAGAGDFSGPLPSTSQTAPERPSVPWVLASTT